MRAFFAYLLALGIALATGYAEIAWLTKSFESAALRPQHSRNIQAAVTCNSHDRSSPSAPIDENVASPEAREGEGKSLVDSTVGRIGGGQSTGRAEERPAVSDAEINGEQQTTGLGHRNKNVSSSSLASTVSSEPNPLSGSNVGLRMTSEPRASEESDHRANARRGSQNRNYSTQRFSELLKHPLELRCITCVLWPPRAPRS